MPLQRLKPYYIQRCYFEREGQKFCYEYMGSSEFEWGDQAKSLRRMFEKVLKVHPCRVKFTNHEVEFCLIAVENFPFSVYEEVLQGLVDQQWHTKEATYLERFLKRRLVTKEEKTDRFFQTEAWFDFENEVLFTTSENAGLLLKALVNIKEEWRKKDEWRNSPPIKKLDREVDQTREKLRKVMPLLLYLGKIEDIRGKLQVWLNTGGDGSGWYTPKQLQDLLVRQEKKFKKNRSQEKSVRSTVR